MTKVSYCPHCGQHVSTVIIASETNNRKAFCPNCGSHFNPDWMHVINKEEASRIVNTRKPLGLFLVEKENCIIGIDNSTGEAWMEEFTEPFACVDWLLGNDFDECM